MGNIIASKEQLAGCDIHKAHNPKCGGCLTGTAFIDNSECGAATNLEGYAVHGMDQGPPGKWVLSTPRKMNL